MSLEFHVLGQLEVVRRGAAIDIGAPKQRQLLALLLVYFGQVLSVERILEELWGDDQPEGGSATLRYHVSKLRDALDPDREKGTSGTILITTDGGYALRVEPKQIDAHRFSEASDRGHELVESHPEEAARVLSEALDLWRGNEQPFADFPYEQFAQAEIARLGELRLRTIEDRIAAELDLDRHDGVLGELEGLVGAHPLRERLAGLLMVALYRSGRQGEALRVFRRTKEWLGEELGIDPSPALVELEEQILLRDERLLVASVVQRDNLPAPATDLIDRLEDRDAVVDLLDRRRIVTLTGPGGIGKTRLAVAAAEEVIPGHRDGVWFVDVSTQRSAGQVVAAIADVLELPGTGSRPPDIEDVQRHCHARQMLLLLDGCEHLVEEVGDVCETLARFCADLRVLATSRERLRLEGEAVWIVDPLGLPLGATPEDIMASAAGALFVDRAVATLPSFELDASNAGDVAEVCRRLDGIPLAIEMAASRLSMLSVAELAERLSDRFSLLASGAGRGEELRTVVDWSHDLLQEREQILLRRLAVFRGGFQLEAAEAVCSAPPLAAANVMDLLQRLVDTSFVSPRGTEERRFRMLDTLREYARDQLATSGEIEEMSLRHAAHYAEVARVASGQLEGPEQDAWLRRMDQDHFNFRAALVHAIDAEDRVLALDLAASLGGFWFERGYHADARLLLSDALGSADGAATSQLARLLAELGLLVMWSGDMPEAQRIALRLREVAEEVDDDPTWIRSGRLAATVAWGAGDFRRAEEITLAYLDSMREAEASGIAVVIGQLAELQIQMGRSKEAERLRGELRVYRDRLGQPEAEPLMDDLAGWRSFQAGNDVDAAARWKKAADGYEALGLQPNVVEAHLLGGWAQLEAGEVAGARRSGQLGLRGAQASAAPYFEARALALLAWAELETGNRASGRHFLSRALARTRASGDRCWTAWSLFAAANALAADGDQAVAGRLVRFGAGLIDEIGVKPPASVAKRVSALGARLERRVSSGVDTPPSSEIGLTYDEATSLAAAALESTSGGT